MTNDLNIQTPGSTGDTETDALNTALEGTAAEIAAGLEDYSDADLARLTQLEADGKGRKGVADAIALEQRRRAKQAAEDEEQATQAGQNDAVTSDYDPNYRDPETAYRHLTARQVDASTITTRVLTKDGWVMPKPAANPVG